MIFSCFRKIVRVSFSAPNASQKCGAFLLCPAGLAPSPIVQVLLVQENGPRTTLLRTSLAELAGYRPGAERLEQKTLARSAFRCASETCTSLCGRWCRLSSCVDAKSLSGNKNRHYCSQRETRVRERGRFQGFLFPTGDQRITCRTRIGGTFCFPDKRWI